MSSRRTEAETYLLLTPPIRRVVQFTRADKVQFAPTDWLVEGWLVKNTLAGLVGASGGGKSFLAIDWACRIATGMHWHGRKVAKGAVFYLAGEGKQGLSKRIHAWESHFGQVMTGSPLYLADGLPFLCEDSQTFGTIDAIHDLADELLFNCGAAEPSLIVVDTVARAMAGENENSAESMGKLVRSLDMLRERWGATVLAVHHTGHEGTRARGSSAFYAALDSEFLLKGTDKTVELAGTKEKDWTKPGGLILEKVQVPVEIVGTDGKTIRDTSLILQADNAAVIQKEKRRQVYRLRAQGSTQREIAQEVGIPKSTVALWLREDGDDVDRP
jgi:hypothetical protein